LVDLGKKEESQTSWRKNERLTLLQDPDTKGKVGAGISKPRVKRKLKTRSSKGSQGKA